MQKKNDSKQEREKIRMGIPPVRETYQDIQSLTSAASDAEKRERRKGEKERQHMAHDKARSYTGSLPPAENRINVERPLFKKK